MSKAAEDIPALYAQAFRDFGTLALWNLRPAKNPTPADALAITQALRTHGRMEGRLLAERIEAACHAAFRSFPVQSDELFGYVLHPADLAANKASAAADRRVPRDIVDLVTIHETILPLGAVIAAAVGKFPGTTPEGMLAEITRHSRFTAEEFTALATERPIDVESLHARIRKMLADAQRFISALPSDAIGSLFLEHGRPVQPDPTRLADYQRHTGAPRGVWPSSSEISSAMLERYDKLPEL